MVVHIQQVPTMGQCCATRPNRHLLTVAATSGVPTANLEIFIDQSQLQLHGQQKYSGKANQLILGNGGNEHA